MVLNLPTDCYQPLFGTVGAKLGLRQVGLEAGKPILDFRPRAMEAVGGFDLGARDTLLRDLGIGLRPVGELPCLGEFGLQVADTALGLGLDTSDARIRLSLRPLDAGVGVGLQLGDCSLDLSPHSVGQPVRLELELIDPSLGVAQLSRQLLCEFCGAIAILVREVRRLLELCDKAGVGGAASSRTKSGTDEAE